MDEDPRLSTLELIILSLTVYTIFSIVVQLIIPVSEEMMKLFNLFEWICSGFFLYEWLYRFRHSKEKKKFVVKNLIDLAASFPIGFLSGLKALRLLRVFQIIKIFGSIGRFKKYLAVNKVYTFKLVLVSGVVLMMFMSPNIILFFEEANGSINTASDALWFTFAALTSCGFGDVTCITPTGRIITVIMSIGGIGFFSMFTGLVVNYVLEKAKEDEEQQ